MATCHFCYNEVSNRDFKKRYALVSRLDGFHVRLLCRRCGRIQEQDKALKIFERIEDARVELLKQTL